MWIWALASGLAAAVVAQGALPGAMVFMLAVVLFWLLLRSSQPEPAEPVPDRAGPLRPSAAMARAALGSGGNVDDLRRIKGLGPKLATALQDAGIRSYAQIAAWTPEEAAAMDEKCGARGRVLRDDWVAQARALALGAAAAPADER
jgi:predicted flap endonuclease-1-like 5' DNA nuclease